MERMKHVSTKSIYFKTKGKKKKTLSAAMQTKNMISYLHLPTKNISKKPSTIFQSPP
jgi:hypothetical protein